MLQSIVCHSGSLNSGHYYAFALKQAEQESVWNMIKCNDSVITNISNPLEILELISGKAQE